MLPQKHSDRPATGRIITRVESDFGILDKQHDDAIPSGTCRLLTTDSTPRNYRSKLLNTRSNTIKSSFQRYFTILPIVHSLMASDNLFADLFTGYWSEQLFCS
jgi:hypothetical protein